MNITLQETGKLVLVYRRQINFKTDNVYNKPNNNDDHMEEQMLFLHFKQNFDTLKFGDKL